MKVTIVDGLLNGLTQDVENPPTERVIEVGTRVLFGAPTTPEERVAYTGVVTDITDPDADYDDELGRAVEYCPRVTVKFDDGSTEIATSYNVTRMTWAHYPDGPDAVTYQADDLEVVAS